jgi:flagellin
MDVSITTKEVGMGLTINRSVGLGAQRNLNKSQKNMQKTFARLSSGLRINSAKDDAAGLAISTRMGSNFRGFEMAIRNANDGISMTQTSEGALSGITENLQRMRELAVQASNGTMNSQDRQNIQSEVGQLTDEINRVSETTTFNGNRLLDGSGGVTQLQVGASAGDTIQMNPIDTRTDSLGQSAQVMASSAGADLQSGDLELNNVAIRATAPTDDTMSTTMSGQSAVALANAINDSSASSGVTATVNDNTVSGNAIQGGTLDSNNSLVINDVTIMAIDIAVSDGGDNLMDAINAATDETGVVASRNQEGNIELMASDGRNIAVETTGSADQITGLDSGVTTGTVTLDSAESFTVEGGDPSAVNLTAGTQGQSAESALTNVDVSTQGGAEDAIARIDRALDEVSSRRSGLGAMQNRLESTVNNLSVASENTQIARSRIADADFAKETAELIRQRLLQRSSMAMSGQANVSQQAALQLLT